ncbi:MAG: hypothetical protein ACRC2T_16745, partial [Thermoguttaceae bacterium]
MQTGKIMLLASQKFQIKVLDTSGVTRTDISPGFVAASNSPLGVTAIQAFRFSSGSYKINFVVEEVKPRVTSEIYTTLKLSEYICSLESKIIMQISGSSLYRLKILIPNNLDVKTLTVKPMLTQTETGEPPFPCEWSVMNEGGQKYILICLSQGIAYAGSSTNVMVEFNGDLTPTSSKETLGECDTDASSDAKAGDTQLVSYLGGDGIEIPIIEVVGRYQHYVNRIGVLVDPAFEVTLQEINDSKNTFVSPDKSLFLAVLKPEQIPFLKLELARGDGSQPHSSKLILRPVTAHVTCDTITNISTQSQLLSETIMLDYKIIGGGLRKVEFTLPLWMKNAKISAPLLQSKKIVEQTTPGDSKNKCLLVTLELQEEVMNELSVLVQSDRLLEPGREYNVAVPGVITGKAVRQYVVLENQLGIDELVVDGNKISGVRAINRQDKQWDYLAQILGAGATDVYLIDQKETGEQANLPTDVNIAFKMIKRDTVNVSNANIGLAETRLILDAGGHYVAEQIYRIDNKKEQYLDCFIPKDAQLWTARNLSTIEWDQKKSGVTGDLGEPIKPCVMSDAEIKLYKDANKVKGVKNADDSDFVKIPLIRTEVGDLDRVVRLVYAGKVESMSTFSKTNFPFIKVLNIPVESVTVELGLPNEHYWYNFDGTLRLANSDAIREQEEEYNRKMIGKLQGITDSQNPFENFRANSNIMLFESKKKGRKGYLSAQSQPSRMADQQQIQIPQTTLPPTQQQNYFPNSNNKAQSSNTAMLQQKFESQDNRKAKNAIIEADAKAEQRVLNNSLSNQVAHGKPVLEISQSQTSINNFDAKWLDSNGLDNRNNNNDNLNNQLSDMSGMLADACDPATDFAADPLPNADTSKSAFSLNMTIPEPKKNSSTESLKKLAEQQEYSANQSQVQSNMVQNARQMQVANGQMVFGDNNNNSGRARTNAQSASVEGYAMSGPGGSMNADNTVVGMRAPSGGFAGGMGGMGGMGGGMMGGGMSGTMGRGDTDSSWQPDENAWRPGMGMPPESGERPAELSTRAKREAGGTSDANRSAKRASSDMKADMNVEDGQMVAADLFEITDLPSSGEQVLYEDAILLSKTTLSPISQRFASLDVELPPLEVVGFKYVFTSPQGEAELSASSTAYDSITRGKLLGWSVLVIVLLWILYKSCVYCSVKWGLSPQTVK